MRWTLCKNYTTILLDNLWLAYSLIGIVCTKTYTGHTQAGQARPAWRDHCSLPKHYNNSWRREVAVVADQNIESLQQEVERIRDEREKLLKLLELGEVEERLKRLIVDHELKSTG
jgi:hypothetical protein